MSPKSFLRSTSPLTLALAVILSPPANGQPTPAVDPATGLPVSGPDAAQIDPNTGALIQNPPKASADPNPINAWTTLLATGKTAEEGDADLTAASDQYVTIVRIFEQLRPVAAEALHRYALVEGRRQHAAESQAALTRLIQWFPDLPGYLRTSMEAQASASGVAQPPVPDAAPGEPARPPMSPELMRRYGLGAANLPAEAAEHPTTFKMSPQLMARYGLLAAPAKPDTKPTPPSLPNAARIAELQDRRAELVTEAARTAADLRKARMELKRVEGLSPSVIPPNLVSDPRLRSLLEEASDRLFDSGEEPAKQAAQRRAETEFHFERVYRPRLERTASILSRELEELRQEIDQIDTDIAKLQPKF